MPAVGPHKIGTIADLALNPILLCGRGCRGRWGGRHVLEDPQSLQDGRRVLDGRRIRGRARGEITLGSRDLRLTPIFLRPLQGDPSGRSKPPVDIDLKVAFYTQFFYKGYWTFLTSLIPYFF